MTALTDVPTRQQWRAHEEARQGQIVVQAMTAFGWKVHRHVMPVGSKLVTQAAAPIPRSKSSNLTLFVRGRATLTHEDGTVYPDRVPGMFSGDRPDTPAGRLTHFVVEELEFWCFNWHANRGALPELSVLRVDDGGTFSPLPGQRVITCAGVLGSRPAGTAFVSDGAALVASGQVYGFLIGGARV
jgi:hypothetical protein